MPVDSRSLPISSLLKVPRQPRSVDMAHVILDAAIIVLQAQGIVGFNTNRVAETAGVSIGTLYQYFANKEMLVAGIVERGVLDSEVLLRETARSLTGARPHEVMSRNLRVIIDDLKPYAVLLREVLHITPYMSTTGVIPLLETRLSDLLRNWLIGDGMAYEPIGGRVGIDGLTRAAVHLTLRHLAEINSETVHETFIESTASLLAAGLRLR